ncbi:F-box/LRR-repeat protein 14-like protein isoform X1 [Tanacetum coccineum]|uniref:F-box/LRR-repeat protein 14-like protein isoform X1 n=1 Tax=Tanacetum coccineum TaxID=301880 RepID=A0ABQ5C4T1_9ASTR
MGEHVLGNGTHKPPRQLHKELFQESIPKVGAQNGSELHFLDNKDGIKICPSLMDLSHLEAFQDCALQDITSGDYPGVDDNWLGVVSSQGLSLLSADLSGSDVTDIGLCHVKDCKNVEDLNMNFCDKISDVGLGCISGLKKLEALNINCCNCITDVDMKPLSDLTNLKELQISCSKVTDHGITFLKGLHKLALLNMERCPITSACLDSLLDRVGLHYLNVSRSNFTDEFSTQVFKSTKHGIQPVLAHLKGLTNLESLNLDSCMIKDGGLVYLSGLNRLKCLELSDTEVGNNGLRHHSDGGLRSLAKLSSLKSLNLDVHQITDAGLAALTSMFAGLTHLDLFCAKITDNGTNYLRNLQNLRSLEICGRVDKFGVFKRLEFMGNRLRIATFSKSEEVEVIEPGVNQSDLI